MRDMKDQESIQCRNCNNDLDVDTDDHQEFDGDIYCQECFDDLFSYCEECGNTVYADDIVSIDDTYMCESCRDDNYTCCYDCDDYVLDDDRICVGDNCICESCYQDNYFSCEGCNEVYHTDYYGSEGYCQDCEQSEDDNGLYSYNYKPDSVFYGDGDLFFGIELEIESEGNSIYDAVQSLPDFVYAKADSSINNGLEVVSHPTSWNWLQENKKQWDIILNLREDGFLSYKTDTCGMHVHLSKKAFSTLHLYKFLKMFFENQEFITIISRRRLSKLERYASLQSDESIVYKAKIKNNTERYTAVNLQNEESVEVRIFRGTLSPVGFWRNVEFCKAVYEYTKIASIKDISADKLCDYIMNQQKEYPNLAQFLVDKNLAKSLFSQEVG